MPCGKTLQGLIDTALYCPVPVDMIIIAWVYLYVNGFIYIFMYLSLCTITIYNVGLSIIQLLQIDKSESEAKEILIAEKQNDIMKNKLK